MELNSRKVNQTLIVEMNGRADATNADQIQEYLLGMIEAGNKNLVLDCSALNYISSAGLRALLVCRKRAGELKVTFSLCQLNQSITEIFEIANFTSIFNIYKGCDEALNNKTL